MVPISNVRSTQSGHISTVQTVVKALNQQAKKAGGLLVRLRKGKGLIEPKDALPVHKILKATASLALTASNALKKIN